MPICEEGNYIKFLSLENCMRGEKYGGDVDLKYTLRVLWSFAREYKKLLLAIFFLIIIGEMISFLDNFIFKYLIDKATLFGKDLITTDAFRRFIFGAVGIYFAINIFYAIIWYFRMKAINHFSASMMNSIEKSSFWHIINLSYRYHLSKRTGSIISQFTRGVNKVDTITDAILFNFAPVAVRITISFSVIYYFDVVTALILGLMTILFIIFGVVITNIQKYPQHIANEKEDILKQNLGDVFLNIETVKYFGKENPTLAYFRGLSQRLKNSRLKFWHYFAWFSGGETVILAFGVAAMLYFSFMSFLNGKLTLGSITLIYAALWRLLPQLFGLMHGYREFVRGVVDSFSLLSIFKEKNEVVDVNNNKLVVNQGDVEFKEVSFSYTSKNIEKGEPGILKDFKLKIGRNTKVALVGPSGSGKTTVIKLLYRLFDIAEGKITIDGVDISKVTQKSLRNSMSIVPQEPLLFDNTIYFNIAYANPNATKAEVWKAIKFAQLDEFIRELPLKEKTLIGERGVKLSGGEKQRVSIARAILADKKILVLDEATSALDSETEKEIQRDLEKLMKGRTTIIIAHRLSTIMKADRIVVLNKGRIVEIGSHDQLRNVQGGLYQRLWKLQQGGRL
jgi:ATP-binding cassette, subfamily B, heavy metal transporter